MKLDGPPAACIITVRFDDAGRDVLDLLGQQIPALPYATAGDARFELLLGEPGARVTAHSEKETPSWSLVRQTGGGALWWDHDTRRWHGWTEREVHCDDERPVPAIASLDDKDRAATLHWHDPAMGEVRLRIHCFATDMPPSYAEAILDTLYGNGCCGGGFPSAKVAALGMPYRCELSLAHLKDPLVTTDIHELKVADVDDSAWRPPKDFEPLDVGGSKDDGEPKPAPAPAPTPATPQPAVGRNTQALESGPVTGRNQQALESEDILSPGCLARTRLGPMVGLVHQDLLDNISKAVNLVAPHLGTVTLFGGTMTVPWLSALAAADLSSGGTGPGSGLFTLLREGRQIGGPPTGGRGVLDRLAWKLMTTRDPATGRDMLMQQAAVGTLAATLTRWGISPAVEAVLLSNGGDMRDTRLTDTDRTILVEAYEVFDIGTITIAGLPSAPPPILWPAPPPGGPDRSLITLTITGITGTMAFVSAGLPPLITNLAIANGGAIDVTIALPTTTIAATIARATTALGTGVLIGASLLCFIFPLACVTITPLALLLLALLNNLARVTASFAAPTLSFRVEFGWNQATRHVEPSVLFMGSTGTATVTASSPAPQSIASAFNAIVTTIGNAINIWPTLVGLAAAPALESFLREQGVRFPLGLDRGLNAMNGTALSTPNGTLILSAEVEPIADTVAQPWITQVPPEPAVRSRTQATHFFARRELNPQTITGTQPFPLAVGTYGGLALTQNVLNTYVYTRWRAGAFTFEITDPVTVTKLVDALPKPTFGLLRPQRITVWPATPPRLELAPEGLHASEQLALTTDPMRQQLLEPWSTGARPLVAYFDDVRVCFSALGMNTDNNEQQSGQFELSFNFRTTATFDLSWPFALELRTDAGPAAVRLTEVRTMEMADGSLASMMIEPAYTEYVAVATHIAWRMAAMHNASGVRTSQDPTTWRRPTPFVVQYPADDMLTLDMLAGHKTLTLMPMLRSPLLELVDGSGSPVLASMLGVNAPIVIGALRRADGATLRTRLGPLLDLAGLVAFPGP